MLSLKRFKEPPLHPQIDDFEVLVDRSPFVKVVNAWNKMPLPFPTDEFKAHHPSYVALSQFLQACVKNCDVVYDGLATRSLVKQRSDRWWRNFQLVIYDNSTGDGVETSAPLEPECGGVDTKVTKPTFHWCLRPDESAPDPSGTEVKLPVEIGEDWVDIVLKAGIHARALFSAVRPT